MRNTKVLIATVMALLSITISCQKNSPIAVQAVVVDKQYVSLYEGDTCSIKATILPEDAENKKVTWKSSDSSVANVKGGLITAVKEGEATITVTTDDGGFTASTTVDVEKKLAESIQLSEHQIDLKVGSSHTLTAKVLPENSQYYKITWGHKKTETKIISGTKISDLSLSVTGEAEGKDTVFVFLRPNAIRYVVDTCYVTVTE